MKAVIFDIDNTLYDYDRAHAAAYRALSDLACGLFGMTENAFDDLHDLANRKLAEHTGGFCAATHNRLIRYQLMLEETGRPISYAKRMSDHYWSTLLDNMTISPGARETLERLREMGCVVGIGTDMTCERQFDKLERLELIGYIDFLVSSEEAGIEKPAKRMFDLCAKKAKCDPGECLFVGDDPKKDVLGACRAGMRAAWYRRPGKAEIMLPSGAFCISHLTELPGLLSSLPGKGTMPS
ncbi:MAG: HAD family hydrolase [Clostridia bacterium]|nr:HAD family hydrolase [Clostridia bacterium]